MKRLFNITVFLTLIISSPVRAEVVEDDVVSADHDLPYMYGTISEYSELRGVVKIGEKQYKIDKFDTKLGQVVRGPDEVTASATLKDYDEGDIVFFDVSEKPTASDIKHLEFLYRVME